MGLITPLFLIGLLGIAMPWWLHRLETQTTEREKFSTTRFLEASRKRIHVQRKLKFLVLMALRMAFLALLAFAFARPVLFSEPDLAVSEDTTHHIIVMDTSFSIQGDNRMAIARQQVNDILDEMGGDDIASLYAASASVRMLAGATDDADEIRALLDSVEADNGHLDFGVMVSSLNGLIERSQASFVLHLVSDFQQDSQAVRFADMIPDVINGRPMALDIRQVELQSLSNSTVEAVVTENRNTVIASIRTFGDPAAPETRNVSLAVNGVATADRDITITGNGIVTVQFDDVVFGEGDNRVDVALDAGDSLPADDIRHAVFDNSPPAPVLLLTDDLQSLGVTYLTAALETAPRGYKVETVDVMDFDPRVMQRYPWLIIEDIGVINGGLEAALRDYINGGGAVFAGMGTRAAALTSLPVLGNAYTQPALAPNGRSLNLPVTRIDNTHPALNDSSGWANVNAHVFRPELEDGDRVLVSQNATNPVLIERSLGAGRMVWLTTSLDNSTSDLPVKPVFVSFMSELARYLSNEKLLVKEQLADSYLQLTQTGGASGQVVDPDGTSLLSLQDTTSAQDVLLNKTGYYQVFTPAGEVLVAVNPDIRESDLTLMPAQTLQNWANIVAGTTTDAVPVTALGAAREAEPEEIEIWRIFLVLLALLVLAESLLGNRYLNLKTGSF
jgi:hypothetical protein